MSVDFSDSPSRNYRLHTILVENQRQFTDAQVSEANLEYGFNNNYNYKNYMIHSFQSHDLNSDNEFVFSLPSERINIAGINGLSPNLNDLSIVTYIVDLTGASDETLEYDHVKQVLAVDVQLSVNNL